jgi:hypothetical protein
MNLASTLTIGILATSLYAAECTVNIPERGNSSFNAGQGYPTTSLYLFEGDYLDLSKMDKREPAVTNVSGTDTAWVYRSAIDSTMLLIVTEKMVQVARVAYSSDPSASVDSLFTIHHNDVYKDEFQRLQKAGVFKGSAEQADSLVEHVFNLCKKYYSKEFGYSGCEFNPPELRKGNQGKDIDKIDIPLAYDLIAGIYLPLLDTLNSCPDSKFQAASDTTTVEPPLGMIKATSNLSFSRIKAGHYRIANGLKGMPYKVFSVNGQLLKQGILTGNVFVAPTLPIILQVNGEETLFLN